MKPFWKDQLKGLIMEKDLVQKDLGKYVKVEAQLKDGKLEAVASLDVAAMLDDLAAQVKAKVPGSAEEPFVDAIVKMLKEQAGVGQVQA